MDRRILYLGIILFVIGIISSALSVQSLQQSFGKPSAQSLMVRPNSVGSMGMALNQTGIISMSYIASNSVDFILSNATAHSSLAGNSTSAVLSNALSLEGNGVYEIIYNSTRGTFPAAGHNLTTTGAGTYYAVFVNSGHGNVSVVADYLTLTQSSVAAAYSVIGNYGFISSLLILVGIILVIISFFRKGPQIATKKQELDEEASKMYAEIETKEKQKKKNKTRKT